VGGGELLWSSTGRRIVVLAVIALFALAVSAGAGASVLRDGVGTTALAASCGTDEFAGSALDDARWDVLRPASDGLAVADGKLNLTLRTGDLINATATAENVVLQDAPTGGWTATTKLNTAAINAQGEQAGLVLWRNEGAGQNAFGKAMFLQLDATTRVVETIWTERSGQSVPTGDSRAAIPATLPADADVLLRMRYDGARVTAEVSLDDGATWTQAGQTAGYSGPLRVGVMGVQGASGNGGVVPFERFDLECAPQIAPSVTTGAAPLDATFTSTGAPDGATLSWDFGDGTTAQGGNQQTHTFAQPGVYRVRQTASVDGGRRLLTGSTVVTVEPAQAPALAQSDEFNGNELDPKWQVLRPRETGVTLSDGHLRLQAYSGDMHGASATATNVLLQNAPQGCAWTATTRIDVSGMTGTGDQAGLILWRSESPYNNFSKVVFNRRSATTWWVERSNTVGGVAGGTTNTATTGVPQYVHIRVNVAADGTVQPERSTDGVTWTAVGPSYSVAGSEPLKIGVAFFAGSSLRRAAFDFFRVESQGECTPPPPCPELSAPEEGFTRIWDGRTVDGWRQAGAGTFAVVNDGAEGCRLETRNGLGLLWYELAQYDDFVLRLQYRTDDVNDNSGVFVRFPNPGTDANIPINQGHEIQIHDDPGGGEPQKTGSIYNLDPADVTGQAKPPGQWNDYEIAYANNTYTITLNGTVINTWTPAEDQRRTPGHIGLQNHGDADRVSFRNIRIQHIGEPYQPNLFTTIGITRSETRANSQIRGTPPYSFPAEEMPPSGTRGPASEDTFDDVPVRMPDTSGNVPDLAAFRGQTLPLRPADQRVYSKIHFFGTTTDGNGGGDFVLRFEDGTNQIVPVSFSDWCAPSNTAAHHVAIGPMSQRYRTTGSDGARCAIYHVPADVTAGKKLVSVTLPRSTTSGSGGNRQAYLLGLTLEEPGGGFRSPDMSGQVQFADDQTSPVSQHTVAPAAPGGGDGWYTEAVTVTLSAADEAGGSGLQRIQYRVNGGLPQDYAAPIELTNDGSMQLEYRAIDVAGNAEGYRPVPIKIDRTAPTTTVRVEPDAPRGAGTWDDRPATVTITARDGNGSGIAVTELHFGDGNWQPYTGPIELDADGRYELHVRSSDVAGNDEAEQTADIGIDATAPTSTARLTSAAPRPGGVHRAPVTVALSAADAQSGVAALEYRLDGGQWRPYAGPFTVSALGGHLVEHRARDHAGNLENAKEAVFAIGTPPQPGTGFGDGPPLPPEPFVGLTPVDRLSVGALVRNGLRVRASCVAVGRGTLSLTVTRKVARRLGLGKRTTLASRSVRCGDESRLTVRLKPSSRVKRALRRADGKFTATLRLRMNGVDGPASDSEKLTLRG
jgi:PKD repeat protein